MDLRRLNDDILLEIGLYLTLEDWFHLENVVQRPIPCPNIFIISDNYVSNTNATKLLSAVQSEGARIRRIAFNKNHATAQPIFPKMGFVDVLCVFVGLRCLDLKRHLLLESDVTQLLCNLPLLKVLRVDVCKSDCCSGNKKISAPVVISSRHLEIIEITFITWSEVFKCACSNSVLRFMAGLSELTSVSIIFSKETPRLREDQIIKSGYRNLVFSWPKIEHIKCSSLLLIALNESLVYFERLKTLSVVGFYIDMNIMKRLQSKDVFVTQEVMPYDLAFPISINNYILPMGQSASFYLLNNFTINCNILNPKLEQFTILLNKNRFSWFNLSIKLWHLKTLMVDIVEEHPAPFRDISMAVILSFVKPSAASLETLELPYFIWQQISRDYFSLPQLSTLALGSTQETSIDSEAMHEVLEELPSKLTENLRVLILSGQQGFQATCLRGVFSTCHHLTELRISCSFFLKSVVEWHRSLPNAAQLRTLSIESNESLEAEFFQSLSQCRRLAHIFVYIKTIPERMDGSPSYENAIRLYVPKIARLTFFVAIYDKLPEKVNLFSEQVEKAAFLVRYLEKHVIELYNEYPEFYHMFWEKFLR